MINKHKNKNLAVKLISAFMVILIVVITISIPCSALVSVGNSSYYRVASSFPLTVSMMYGYGVSESGHSISNPYTFSIDVGGNGQNYMSDIEVGVETFDYTTNQNVDVNGKIEYSVTVPEFTDNRILVSQTNPDSYVKTHHKEYNVLGYANLDEWGNPQDVLQKVCFTANDVVYNPAVLLYADTVSSNDYPNYTCLPYLEFDKNIATDNHMIDFSYNCSFTVITNNGLVEEHSYTKEWRGSWADNGRLFLIEPEELKKYGDYHATIMISDFVGELTYHILTENSIGDTSINSPYGCWKLMEYSDSSAFFSEMDIPGEFFYSTEAMEGPVYVKAQSYDELVFNNSILSGYNAGVKIRDLYVMYYLNEYVDKPNQYLYVHKIENKEHEALLLGWLEKYANFVQGSSVDVSYQSANIMSSNFDYSTQNIEIHLPFYDTSHVSDYDIVYNDSYKRHFSYPDFEKFYNTINYSDGGNDVIIPSGSQSWVGWIVNAVGGFFDFEIFPDFTLGGLLAIITSFSLVLILLRWLGGS